MAKTRQTQLQRAPAALPAPVALLRAKPIWTWVTALGVLALTFLAYVPALQNEFLDWDDDTNFLNNPDYRGLGWPQVKWMFTAFHAGHFQPIAWLTLGWDFVWGQRVFGADPQHGPGMDPRAYHISNNLYHSINAALVYLVALRLLAWTFHRDGRARTLGLHVAAATAGLLWSVHPMRVENVAWITERRDLVSGLLLLATVLAYLRAAQLEQRRRWMWIGISLALYALSLMAKVAGVPLPVVLIALDLYPLRRLGGNKGHSAKSVWIEKALFFVPALAFSRIATAGQASHGWLFSLEQYPMDSRIVQTFYGLFFYVKQTIVPVHLLPLYELKIPMDASQARFAVAIVAVIGAGLALAVLALKRRAPGLLVTAVCYGAFLGPVLGFFQNGPQIVADRYSYLPAIGMMIAFVGGCLWLARRAAKPREANAAAILAAVACTLVLGGLTWQQCKVWRTTESMWEFTLKYDKESSVANNGYGRVLYVQKGQAATGAEYFQRAVELDPFAKHYRSNLRNALRDSGQTQKVIQAWVDEARFGQFTAHYHLQQGTNALLENRNDQALEHLTVSLALNEKQPKAHANLAIILARLDRLDEAINHNRRAMALDPLLPNPRYSLALNLIKKGNNAEAAKELEALLAIDPNHAEGANLLRQLRGQ